MIQKLVIGLLVLVLAVVGIAYVLPRTVHVERSVVIEAQPEKIFAQLNSFENFNAWSPWNALDPDAQYSYSGPTEGVGSRMSWTSEQPNVGNGSQEILKSKPYEFVETELDFGEQGTATAVFKLTPVADGTQVVWGFDTDLGMNPVARYMGLMFDSWIGKDYETGLNNLKTLVESMPEEDQETAINGQSDDPLPVDSAPEGQEAASDPAVAPESTKESIEP